MIRPPPRSTLFPSTPLFQFFLDPMTRGRREDGSFEARPIDFTLTIPNGATAGTPLPVVIFGHGLMTERRFVLAVADSLRSEEHTSELQSLAYLVCRLLLEKK